MDTSPFEMRFDPQTIKHLGIRMYSRLAPALAEIISNAYDADATNVVITLNEKNGTPQKIQVEDDGVGISHDEINNKFLVILVSFQPIRPVFRINSSGFAPYVRCVVLTMPLKHPKFLEPNLSDGEI